MLEDILIKGFAQQLAEINQAVAVERAKLQAEEDPEKSLLERDAVRRLEVFAGEVKGSRDRVLIADAECREAEMRFLKWRTAYIHCQVARTELERAAKGLAEARAAVEPARDAVDRADAVIANFRRLDMRDFPTAPALERERIELAKLASVRSEALGKLNGLRAIEANAQQKWMDAGQRLAAAQFQERQSHPPEPQIPKHSIGELLPVR